jgi:hypothetical protein
MPGRLGHVRNWFPGKSLMDKGILRMGNKPFIDAEFCITQLENAQDHRH